LNKQLYGQPADGAPPALRFGVGLITPHGKKKNKRAYYKILHREFVLGGFFGTT
jgi:hypothetical protein